MAGYIAKNKENFLKRHAEKITLIKDPAVGMFHMYTTLGSIAKAIKELGVSYDVHRGLMVHDPEYHDIIQNAQNFIDDDLEGLLIRVAKGKEDLAGKSQLTAILALLNNRRYKTAEDASQISSPVLKRFMVLRPSKKEEPEDPTDT